MSTISHAALALLILLGFCILPSLADPLLNWQNTISFSGTVQPNSNQIKFLRQTFRSYGWSTQQLNSTIDVYQSHYGGLYKAQELEAIRPATLTLVYYNPIYVWSSVYPPEYDAEKLQMFMENGWVLKDTSGNYVMEKRGQAFIVDIGNPEFHTWLANWCKDYIDQYGLDGVSLDNWNVGLQQFYSVLVTPVNPRTGNPWTNQDVCEATKAMTQKVREVIGPNKIILANGVYNGNHIYNPSYGTQKQYEDAILTSGVNAIMSEGWLCSGYDANDWISEENWLLSIRFASWLEDSFPASGGKYFMPIHGDQSWFVYSGTPTYPSDMSKTQYEQFVLYGHASRLLTVKELTTIYAFGAYIENAFPQSLLQIDIGNPVEPYCTIDGSHVYARKFARGIILVNPTYDSYTVNIGSGYKNAVTGGSVSAPLTVKSHTGLILETV